jgi:hypothetical protein
MAAGLTVPSTLLATADKVIEQRCNLLHLFRSPPWHFAGAKNITPNETRALAIIRLGGPSGCAHLD